MPEAAPGLFITSFARRPARTTASIRPPREGLSDLEDSLECRGAGEAMNEAAPRRVSRSGAFARYSAIRGACTLTAPGRDEPLTA